MKRLQKGSFTIEATVVIPLLLFAIGIIMVLLFYCHDKNVLQGAVSEAAHIEAGRAGSEDYNELVQEKLFWFANPRIEVTEEDGHIVARGTAANSVISIRAEAKVTETAPETFIRNVRKIKRITGGEDGDILSNGFE